MLLCSSFKLQNLLIYWPFYSARMINGTIPSIPVHWLRAQVLLIGQWSGWREEEHKGTKDNWHREGGGSIDGWILKRKGWSSWLVTLSHLAERWCSRNEAGVEESHHFNGSGEYRFNTPGVDIWYKCKRLVIGYWDGVLNGEYKIEYFGFLTTLNIDRFYQVTNNANKNPLNQKCLLISVLS